VDKVSDKAVSEHAVRQELARLVQSAIFAQSDRLVRFLRFTIDHAVSGRTDALKEYIIGTEVYDRKPPYHPSQDSIVRTEARRLRSKLKEYYEVEGKNDPVFIYFRPGSYVPVFRSRETFESDSEERLTRGEGLFIDQPGVSIAVIPFLDVSGSPLSAACAQGITDELVHELMRTEGCRVVAASSMAQLGVQASDIPALAERLGVQIVFEGTVREEGSRVRVTSRIVNADGFQLWSQRFDAEPDPKSLFKVQEQIASALMNRVAPQQTAVRKLKASAGPSILAVYPAILGAEALLDQGTASDVQAALIKFQEVADIAPGYARAYCGIAECCYAIALRGAHHSSDIVSQARKAATRALELDPQMVEALSAMGGVLTLEWDWSGAEASFIQATKMGSHATSFRQFAMFLTALERFDEAWLYLQRSQQIDPFSYRQKIACARFFYLSRRYEEALEHFSAPLTYGPLPLEIALYQALVHIRLGHHDEAKRLAQSVQRSVGGQLPLRAYIAEIFASCGDVSLATKIVEEFRLLTPTTGLSGFRQASLWISLGNWHKALSSLSEASANREAELPWLAVDPRFDPIREIAPYGEILDHVKSGIPSSSFS
jgi:TolB-like protein/Tfp pilus assembly protein PilF